MSATSEKPVNSRDWALEVYLASKLLSQVAREYYEGDGRFEDVTAAFIRLERMYMGGWKGHDNPYA